MGREQSELPDPEFGVWYWDRRNNKAYTPCRIDEDTVQFITVWHLDEFGTARDEGELLPVDMETGIPGDIGPDYTKERDTAFNIIDSFRFLPDEAVERHYDGGGSP